MLSPVVLPIPVALAVVALLAAYIGLTARTLLADPLTPRPAKRRGRHAVATAAPGAYHPRPWTVVVEDVAVPVVPGPEPVQYGLLDPEVPLAEVEEYLRNIGFADWYQPITYGPHVADRAPIAARPYLPDLQHVISAPPALTGELVGVQ